MSRERRYALTAIEGPTDVPGLTQDAISGISYQVDSSGTRTPLGGGSGSLPSWWTVDSTPDQERVTFNGGVQSLAPAGYGGKIVDFGDEEGNTEFVFDKDGLQFWLEAAKVLDIDHVGAVTISPSDLAFDDALLLSLPGNPDDWTGGAVALHVRADGVDVGKLDGYGFLTLKGDDAGFLLRNGDNTAKFRVDQSGAVAVSPSGGIPNPVTDVALQVVASVGKPNPFYITGPPVGTSFGYLVEVATGDPDYSDVFTVGPTGAVTISPSDPAAIPLFIDSPSIADDGYQTIRVRNEDGTELIEAYADGNVRFNAGVGGSVGQTAMGIAGSGRVTMNMGVQMNNLPTSDPVQNGLIWNDGGTLKVSSA